MIAIHTIAALDLIAYNPAMERERTGPTLDGYRAFKTEINGGNKHLEHQAKQLWQLQEFEKSTLALYYEVHLNELGIINHRQPLWTRENLLRNNAENLWHPHLRKESDIA